MKIFTIICKYNHYIKPFVYLLYVCIFSHENVHLLLYSIQNNNSYNNQNKYITNDIISNTETNIMPNKKPIKLVVDIPDIIENKIEQEDTPHSDIHKNTNTNINTNTNTNIHTNDDNDNDNTIDDNSIDKNDYDYITMSPEKCSIQKYFSKKWLKKFFE